MLVDRSRLADGAPAQAPGREQLVAMLAGIRDGAALHTMDEMATEPGEITHEESELLQAESLAARALDQDLADGLRHRPLGGETEVAPSAVEFR
jgi:hypothetical protein